MEWIRGMAKGKWVKGNGIRPVNCKGKGPHGCGFAATGWFVSVVVIEQMEFPFVPSVPFRPACGSRLVVCGDALLGFRLLLTCDRRAARAFLKELTNLRLDC